MRWRIALAALAVAAAVGLGLARPWSRANDGQLTLYGNVDIREVDLGFRVGGRIATLHVEEGDRVVPGQLLATLDARPFEDDVALANARLAAQLAAVAKLETGTRPQEIDRARATLAQRKATLERVRRDFERKRKLFAQGDVAESVFDDARTTLDEAQAAVEAAEAALDLAVEGPRDEDIAAGRAQLEAARAELDRARTALADTELDAPDAGTVLSRLRERGAIVAAGAPVYTLTLTDPIRIRAWIAEPDLGRIAPRRPVEVTTDTRPDHPYDGRIGFISPTAEFTPRTVQTEELRSRLVYRLHVIVEDGDGLHQGMPVTVRVPEDGPTR
jgi:HlyD family secretion protein